MDDIRSQMQLPPDATYANLPEPGRGLFIREIVDRIRPRYPDWQRDAIREMRQLLSSALNLPA